MTLKNTLAYFMNILIFKENTFIPIMMSLSKSVTFTRALYLQAYESEGCVIDLKYQTRLKVYDNEKHTSLLCGYILTLMSFKCQLLSTKPYICGTTRMKNVSMTSNIRKSIHDIDKHTSLLYGCTNYNCKKLITIVNIMLLMTLLCQLLLPTRVKDTS